MSHDVSYTNCEKCGVLLTERYVSKRGTTCMDCQRDVGLKVWYTLWGPGSASQ